MLAQPQEAAQDIGDMRAEDAPVRVRLVDHDVAQLLEELEPLRVMRQDRRVEHVRVGDHDLARAANGRSNGRRRIAVVDAGRDLQLGCRGEPAEGCQLVLAERLGREQVQRASRWILRDGVQDRQVVAQRLARRGGRDDDDVLAALQGVERVGLVGVEHLDALSVERSHQALVEPIRKRRRDSLALRQDTVGDKGIGDVLVAQQALESSDDPGRLIQSHAAPPV